MLNECNVLTVLDSILSALPLGNYFVFDHNLRLKLFKGLDIVLEDFENKLQDIDSLAFLELPFLSKFNLNHKHFANALSGESFVCELYLENVFHCFRISPVVIPRELIVDDPEHSEQFLLFSWIQKNQIEMNDLQLKDISTKQLSIIGYEESLFREIKNIFDWRKEIGKKGKHNSWMVKALPNLNTSLMQGTGLGGLVTSMGAMLRKVEKNGNVATIPIRHLELVEENFKYTKKLVNSLAVAQRYFEESDFGLELLTVQEIISLIKNITEDLEDMLKIKNQKILVSFLPNANSYHVKINRERLVTTTKELFINAMKYSPEGISLIVLFLITGNNFLIKFINPSYEDGIRAMDYGHSDDLAFFQPFFRLGKVVDERFDKEEFALGLGLAIVKKIIEDMDGNIQIGTIQSGIYRNVLQTEQVDKHFAEVCVTLEFNLV